MVLEDMRAALEPVGCYDTAAPNLNAELIAYAGELERLYGELNTMIADRFIETADADALTSYEEMFGPALTEETLSERRRRLKLRFDLGSGDFTPAGIRRALDSFGFEYTIAEFPAQNRLNIEASADYSASERSFIGREVSKIIPSHLEYQLLFNTLTWSQLDARELTFRQLDNNDLTWDQIDSIC